MEIEKLDCTLRDLYYVERCLMANQHDMLDVCYSLGHLTYQRFHTL